MNQVDSRAKHYSSLNAEPLGFDEVADKLHQHWEATTSAQASSTAQSSTEHLSDVGTTDSNTTDTNRDPTLVLTKLEPSQSIFQLMQPFSDAGIARQAEQVGSLLQTLPDKIQSLHWLIFALDS